MNSSPSAKPERTCGPSHGYERRRPVGHDPQRPEVEHPAVPLPELAEPVLRQEDVAHQVGAAQHLLHDRSELVGQPDEVGRAEQPLAETAPDPFPLQRRHRGRQPVALGVVAEEVLLGGEQVGLLRLGRAVEDVLADVGGGRLAGSVVGEPSEAQREVPRAVHDAVDQVVLLGDVESTGLGEGSLELGGAGEMSVGHGDVLARRHEAERELREDAERAVAAVDVLEQLGRLRR